MAAKEEPYDILLLGKTGMGKSTTGNHLVENPDGARIDDVLHESRKRYCRIEKEAEKRLTKFEQSGDKESCTDRPEVLHNLDTNIRVMDTKGFAGSKLEQGVSPFSDNLSIMRSILTWQHVAGMSFRRVLYFLPSRTPLERLDSNLQKEVEIMLHFFGVDVFNCMVLVFTLHPGAKGGITPDDWYNDWESETKGVMLEVIRRATKRCLKVNLPEDFECPPVVFIPKAGPSDKIITTIKEAKVLMDEPYPLVFRNCVKCGGILKFPPSEDPNICKEFGTDPIVVIYDNDEPIEFAESKCHPGFVSKYSFGQKLGGGLAYIASLGMLRLAEVVNEAEYVPFFGNSEEVCVTCKKPPGSRGCMTVNTPWKLKEQFPCILVVHNSIQFTSGKMSFQKEVERDASTKTLPDPVPMAGLPNVSGRFSSLEVTGVRRTGRRLGKGSDAIVEEVEWQGRFCAAKILHEILLGDDSPGGSQRFVEGFKKECLRWSTLSHPHVAQFLGVYFIPGSTIPILLLEKMDTSLRTFLEENERKGFLLSDKIFILLQVVQGLAYLHSLKPALVHHDLSPNNILLNREVLQAKLTDFGMSRAVDSSGASRKSSVKGTQAFMSPEALIKPLHYDEKLDVFSFGNVIITTLTHAWPHPGAPTKYKGNKILGLTEFERREQYIIQFSPGERAIFHTMVRSCLENRPNLRPTSLQLVGQMRQIEKDHPRKKLTGGPTVIEQRHAQLQ